MPKLLDFPEKKKFEFRNKSETVSEILLYGVIGEDFWGDSITAKAFAEEMKKLPASVKTIELRVNSPGGSVFDGMTMYERLKNHSAKVIAYVDGMAMSIASVIVMAADEIIVGEGAMMMIHKPLAPVYGNASEMERMIDILDKIESQMVSIYVKKTGMSRAELTAALAKETYYTAQEAVDAGLADKVSAADSLKVAALQGEFLEKVPWLKGAPKMQSANSLAKEKIREFNKEAKKFLKLV